MDLTAEVTDFDGIGTQTANFLKKYGIYTVRDLLYFLPRDYDNFQSTVKICDLKPGKVIVRGKISELTTKSTHRRGFRLTYGKISDETGSIKAIWFNQPYREKQFDPEREYYFTGMYDFKNGSYQLSSPSAVLVDGGKNSKKSKNLAEQNEADLQPIYRAKGSMKSVKFHQIFDKNRSRFAMIPDLLPGAFLNDSLKIDHPSFVRPGARAEALYKIHFPETTDDIIEAKRYLSYEEVFEMLLAANLAKQENNKLCAEKLPFIESKTKALIASLPFKLTDAQRKATWEILQDLEKDVPMNRLLQGDVGSGKTIVAAIAAYQAICNGYQVALLAPTAILATQHAESLRNVLEPLGVKIALLISATKQKERLKREIEQGKYDLIIGTHAIITDDVNFNSLAFCIIDEQHRFGVNQRQKLLSKASHNRRKLVAGGNNLPIAPHLLSMTATPIPRSLQLTVFGDLDCSIINQLPSGRQPIETKIITETDQREVLYPHVISEVEQGHQVYWICRTIKDSPSAESASVKKQCNKLRNIFPNISIEFLHGRMKPAEKDDLMERFAKGKIDILVSTTVVEVGVNVPNATLMVIMNSEDYGLAQLHQLRGRVGRGAEASTCYLMIAAENKPTKRLKAMERSTDGFYLAEMDLKIRGPGEIYGSLQHGELNLQIANLADTGTISLAARQAKVVAKEISKNPEIMLQYKELSRGIVRYQQLTTLN
ncbi:ATP-dependent DNA helicase RecG [Candidatus Saccharibacteria bacterium]|nr:ATP-dependent DNA helicase RecG [Candidatus Saccharibacteria bacterium]